jgi:hypothetical protein
VIATENKQFWYVPTAIVVALLTVAPRLYAREELVDEAESDRAVVAVRSKGIGVRAFLGIVFDGHSSTETAGRFLEACLRKRLDVIQAEYHLTLEQSSRLQLAGRGDIKRFLDRVGETQKNVVAVRNDRGQVAALMREYATLKNSTGGEVPQDGSLFAKTFCAVVTGEQAARAAKLRREREQTRYREAIAETVGKLSRALSLTAEQRERFIRILVTESSPPEKSGDSRVAYVMFQAARLPRSKLAPIFDEDQRRVWWQFFESYENIEEFLRDDGFVFDTRGSARRSLLAPAASPRPARLGGRMAIGKFPLFQKTAKS